MTRFAKLTAGLQAFYTSLTSLRTQATDAAYDVAIYADTEGTEPVGERTLKDGVTVIAKGVKQLHAEVGDAVEVTGKVTTIEETLYGVAQPPPGTPEFDVALSANDTPTGTASSPDGTFTLDQDLDLAALPAGGYTYGSPIDLTGSAEKVGNAGVRYGRIRVSLGDRDDVSYLVVFADTVARNGVALFVRANGSIEFQKITGGSGDGVLATWPTGTAPEGSRVNFIVQRLEDESFLVGPEAGTLTAVANPGHVGAAYTGYETISNAVTAPAENVFAQMEVSAQTAPSDTVALELAYRQDLAAASEDYRLRVFTSGRIGAYWRSGSTYTPVAETGTGAVADGSTQALTLALNGTAHVVSLAGAVLLNATDANRTGSTRFALTINNDPRQASRLRFQAPDGLVETAQGLKRRVEDLETSGVPGGIADGSVTTAKIADDAVTEAKLAPAVRTKLNASAPLTLADFDGVLDLTGGASNARGQQNGVGSGPAVPAGQGYEFDGTAFQALADPFGAQYGGDANGVANTGSMWPQYAISQFAQIGKPSYLVPGHWGGSGLTVGGGWEVGGPRWTRAKTRLDAAVAHAQSLGLTLAIRFVWWGGNELQAYGASNINAVELYDLLLALPDRAASELGRPGIDVLYIGTGSQNASDPTWAQEGREIEQAVTRAHERFHLVDDSAYWESRLNQLAIETTMVDSAHYNQVAHDRIGARCGRTCGAWLAAHAGTVLTT